MKKLVFPLLLIFCLPWPSLALDCPRKARAVLDVGSGATKMTLAEIEACPGQNPKVVRILDDESSEHVALEAAKDTKGNIPDAAIERLRQALERLQAKAIAQAKKENLKTLEVAAAGTHAIRTAKNVEQIRAQLKIKGFQLLPLTQEQEALIGLNGVKPFAKDLCPSEDHFLVWDIGGGSQQFTEFKDGKTNYAGLSIGAEKFKSELLAALPKRQATPECALNAPSPNPIGEKNISKSEPITRHMLRQLKPNVKKLDFANLCVIGIGGVHAKAVVAQLKRQWPQIRECACAGSATPKCELGDASYSQTQLKCLAQQLAKVSDCDAAIKGPYSSTSVSNLLMVEGLMRALGIANVHTRAINMGHALVTDHERLQFIEHPVP